MEEEDDIEDFTVAGIDDADLLDADEGRKFSEE